MKKFRILALILALAACLSLVSCKRREGEASRGLELTLSESGTYYTVTGMGKCRDVDVLLPKEHKGLPVAAIGERAFKGTEITRLTLTENVLFIAENAFESCAGITYNELDGLYYLGTEKNPAYALFSVQKNSDSTFKIHKDTKILADCALFDCDIKELVLPEGITHIGDKSFYHCTSLQALPFPSTLVSIGTLCFAECTSLTTVRFPYGLAVIERHAFARCSNLREAYIPSSVRTIDEEVFDQCGKATVYCRAKKPFFGVPAGWHKHWAGTDRPKAKILYNASF